MLHSDGAALLLLAGWLVGGWYFAGEIVNARPSPYDPAEEARDLADVGIDAAALAEHVTIDAGEVRLAATVLRQPDGGDCGVVLLNGIGGTRTQVIPAVPLFWELGCHVLLYDFRGTGMSTPAPRTYGYFEKHDNAAVIAWLAERFALERTRIGLWGVSFGAAVALQTLELEPELAFVVADSSFASLSRILGEATAARHGVWGRLFVPVTRLAVRLRTGMAFGRVVPADSVRGAAVPVLVVHAADDGYIAVDHAERIHAAGAPATSLAITRWGARHGESLLADFAAYRKLVRGFFAERGVELAALEN